MTIRERIRWNIVNYCRCTWPGADSGEPAPERCECDDRFDEMVADIAACLDERAAGHVESSDMTNAKSHEVAGRREECEAIAAELRGGG